MVEEGRERDGESVTSWVIVTLGGCTVLLVVAITTIKIVHYRRSKRSAMRNIVSE